MIFNSRIISLIIKEFVTLLKDPKGRLVLIGPPIMQLLVFAFASTLEVKNVTAVIYNQDTGVHGNEIVQRICVSKTFSHVYFADSISDFESYIDQQLAIVAVNIPQDFSRDIESGKTAGLQTILDGRRSNAAQIVNGYITGIIKKYEQELLNQNGHRRPVALVVGRSWFNENLLYMWYTIPSLVGVISMIIGIVVTALSVARERELGTFDQLLVSPLMPYEILIGKTVPAVIISILEGILICTVGVFVLRVPFTGSFPLLLMVLFFFLTSIVGVGLFISSISKTQQQAILGAFVFLVPSITLSGYAAPIDNMPQWLQYASWFNPLKHVLISLRGIFLKDMPFQQVWSHTWPLFIIGFISLSLAGVFFSKKLE